MAKFVNELKKYDDFIQLGGVSKDDIENAEKRLGIRFAKEYKEYLKECGAATANAHEYTGICQSQRLNVVAVTEKNRRELDFFNRAYVVEEVNVDGIVIWQTEDGTIYQSQGNNVSELSGSLVEYVKL